MIDSNKKKINLNIKKLIIIFEILIICFLIFGKTFLFKKPGIFIINKTNMEIKLGETLKIDYTISGDNINITWSSDNDTIVRVDSLGNITGLKLGTTYVVGSAIIDDKKQDVYCLVKVYDGIKNIDLRDISLTDGEVLMSKGQSFQIPIELVPKNAYIESINYYIDNKNVVEINDGIITAKENGKATIKVVINNTAEKEINVNVVDGIDEPKIVSVLDKIVFEEQDIDMNVSATKEIKYHIEPNDAHIYNVKWQSSNEIVATVTNGVVKALSPGEADIVLTINDNVSASIKVSVNIPVTSIELENNLKSIIKVGEIFNLKAKAYPNNATNKKIVYESKTPSVINVSQSGAVTGLSHGDGIVLIKSDDGLVTKEIRISVLPTIGLINGTGNIWGFSKSEDTVPVRANAFFFQSLANKGIGSFSNNKFQYQYTKDGEQFVCEYNVNNSIFSSNGARALMRIYYPSNKDLSKLNTFTFLGGAGEINFDGYFYLIEKDLSIIKSSGIIILLAFNENIEFNSNTVVKCTNFVNAILKQSSDARNAIGCYSASGPQAGEAAEKGNYTKFLVFDSQFYYIDSKVSLKEKELVFYSPVGDALTNNTISTLNQIAKSNYKNVTVVSNNNDIINRFSNKFLVINPGTAMGTGHSSVNITNSKFFSYACD